MGQTLETVQSVLDEWEALAVLVAAPPFLHPGWITAWADSFAGGRVSVLPLRRDGRLVGLAPLVEDTTGTKSPTNWHTPRFGLLAEDEAARRELCRLLVERARHRLDVCFLYSGTHDVRDLRDAARESG